MTLPQTSSHTTAPPASPLSRAAPPRATKLTDVLRGWVRAAKSALPAAARDKPAQGEPQHPPQRGGLFRKYAALLVALVGGSLIVSAVIEMYYSWGESRQALIAVQREKAQGAAAVIEQFVKEIEGQVGWATGFLPAGSALEQRRTDFLRLLRQAPAITEVSYLDADGREQIKVSRLAMDTLASGADLSREPKFAVARAKKRYLSPVYFRKESEPYITLAMAGMGRSAGVTVAEVNLKFILDDISRLHVGKAGVAYVVDEDGLLIAHPDIGLVLRKTDLSRLAHVRLALNKLKDSGIDVPAVSLDQSGREVLTASAPIGSLGWLVFVDLPLSEALQPVYAVLYRTLGVLAGGLLLAALAGVWLARRMVVPISAVAQGAARIGGGDLDYRIDVRSGDEVQSLADSFNDMGGRLKAYYAGLERTVGERTRELSAALEQQTATSEVLSVISRSPTELRPVLDTIVETASRLCEAYDAVVLLSVGDKLTFAAHCGPIPVDFTEWTINRRWTAGRAFVDCKPIHVHDLAALGDEYPDGHAMAMRLGHRTILSTPLLRRGEAIGVLTIRRTEVRPFSDKQIALLQTFADQAVIAIENVRLFEEVEARTAELTQSLEYQTAISNVLSVISRSPDTLQPVLASIVETAQRLCQSDRAQFFRLGDGKYHLAAEQGTDPDFLNYLAQNPISAEPGSGSATSKAVREQRTIHVPDVLADAEFAGANRLGRGRSVLAVPLVRDRVVIGVITLAQNTVRPFTARQIELIETFASQALIAIENTRLFEVVEARTRELQELLEYQTATGEVLGVISRSPTDLQPVLATIVETAARLCGADKAIIRRRQGDSFVVVAAHGGTAAQRQYLAQHPVAADPRSVVGRVALTRRSVHIPDIRTEPGFQQFDLAQEAGFASLLAVPLSRKGELVGVLVLSHNDAYPFTSEQIERAETFADQAVIAIENARLFEEVQARTAELSRSVAELKALGQVSQAVNSSLDLKIVLATILGHACEMSDTGGGAIYVLNEDSGELLLEAGHNMTDEHLAAVRQHPIHLGDPVVGECALRGEAVEMVDVTAEARSYPLFGILERAGFRALLAVPLLHQGRAIGALIVRRRRPGAFAPDIVNLLKAFASQSSLAIYNARLFHEIERKGEQLAVASQHKSQFLANMSHELRTPLNAILGYTELMLDGLYGDLPSKTTEVLERVQKNGTHLLGLINDVLDLSKIEAGQLLLSLEEYSLKDIVQTVVSATESLASAKKLPLKVDMADGLPLGLGDARRITQVFLNLVGNAIKFTDVGEVRIAAQMTNAMFSVAVADTGPGIPAAEQALIFNEFHQVDSSNTKKKGGTGLGLAIAKRIVELHGGRIWVKSELGSGATFLVELPVRAEQRKGAA
jgi:signal transduction histidine kinase/HAMP domain-containing protein